MTAQDLLNEAMRRLSRTNLANYVRRYENRPDTIESGCGMCAVGAMRNTEFWERTCGLHGYGQRQRLWPALREGDFSVHRNAPLFAVEMIFEVTAQEQGHSNPRRLVYQACVEELARRESLSVAPLVQDAVHTQPIT